MTKIGIRKVLTTLLLCAALCLGLGATAVSILGKKKPEQDNDSQEHEES